MKRWKQGLSLLVAAGLFFTGLTACDQDNKEMIISKLIQFNDFKRAVA